MNPAPILALTSLIGNTKPVGAPFSEALSENEYWVFAMQIGRPENPCLLYISICFSAYLNKKRNLDIKKSCILSRSFKRYNIFAPFTVPKKYKNDQVSCQQAIEETRYYFLMAQETKSAKKWHRILPALCIQHHWLHTIWLLPLFFL